MKREIQEQLEQLTDQNFKIVTAESCTAGMLASLIGEAQGAAKWLECAFVTYSVAAKIRCLGVKQATIDEFGLTSEEVAREMAQGALPLVDANLAIATTGVADDSGNAAGIEPGTICFCWAFELVGLSQRAFSETARFQGTRNSVRRQASEYAITRIAFYREQLHSQ
jgi:nicotinamide-nucleotide amidase